MSWLLPWDEQLLSIIFLDFSWGFICLGLITSPLKMLSVYLVFISSSTHAPFTKHREDLITMRLSHQFQAELAKRALHEMTQAFFQLSHCDCDSSNHCICMELSTMNCRVFGKKLSFLRWVVGKDGRSFSVPSNCCTQVKWLYETETTLEFKFARRLLLKTIFGPNQQLDGSSSLCIVWQLVLTINEFCAGGFLHTDVKGVTDSGNQARYFCAGTGNYNHLTNNFHN